MKGLTTGDSASLNRLFTPADLEMFAKLTGAQSVPETVPEPLLGALWSCLLGMHLPGLGTMYLKQKSRWRRGIAAGENIVASVTITRLRPEKHLVDLETLCISEDGKVLAEGTALVYVRDLAE